MARPPILNRSGELFHRQLKAAMDYVETLVGGGGSWGSITGTLGDQTDLQTALNGKAATAHTHAIADTTGLQAALDGKQASGYCAAASHTHATSEVTGLDAALSGKQPLATVLTNTTAAFTTAQETKLSGIETAADVTDATNVAAAGAIMDGDFSSNGLMKRTGAGTYATAVAGTDYVAPDTQLTDLAGLAYTGNSLKVLRVNAGETAWELATPAGGATNLTYTAATRIIASDTGTDATLPLVTSGDAGLAPASGGGTANFLRADGTWAAPGGGGGATIYYGHLQADYTLTSSTAVQKLFNWSTNGALTLATGVYRFRSMIYLTTMSATSGNGSFRLKGGGTATVARVLYHVTGIDNTSPLNAGTRTGSAAITENSAASMVSAGTGTGLTAIVEGFFDVTVTGTIIPSIALVTAAAAVVKAGSFFECERVGDTATAASSGWT